MTVIAISSFLGENRAAEPKLIPDGQGTVSLNQKPGRGDLRPWREPAQVFTALAAIYSQHFSLVEQWVILMQQLLYQLRDNVVQQLRSSP
jgi:hypothetical protein